MLYGALAYVSQSGFSYIEAQLSYISRFSNDGCTDRWPWNWAFTRSEAGPSAIFEGARNARSGERQFAAGRGLAESNLHLFEPVQLLL